MRPKEPLSLHSADQPFLCRHTFLPVGGRYDELTARKEAKDSDESSEARQEVTRREAISWKTMLELFVPENAVNKYDSPDSG